MDILQAVTRLTVLVGAVVLLAVAALATVQAQPASASMCMVDCWDDDGGWAGGGGLGGGDGGGDPGDGIGGGSGGGPVGEIPDHSPSGTGWNDPRLPPADNGGNAGTGGSGSAGELPVVGKGTTTCYLGIVPFTCPYTDFKTPTSKDGVIRQCYWTEFGQVKHTIPCGR